MWFVAFYKLCCVCLVQAEGEAAYADVQHANTPHSADRQHAGSVGTPAAAARLSAAHITTTPSSQPGGAAMRTPQPVDVSRALLSQAETPVSAAAQLSAQLAVSPSVLTPGVAAAMAEAGEAVAAAAATAGAHGQEANNANLEKIKAKLTVLKEHIHAKTKRMSNEKRAQIEAQIEKLEKSLAYVEKQRVSRGVGLSTWGDVECTHAGSQHFAVTA